MTIGALSGKYGNTTTVNACTSNDMHVSNITGPGTLHQNILRHLGIIHVQIFSHSFTRYLPIQKSKSNYLGRCKCTTNLNGASRRTWHNILSTSVSRQRHIVEVDLINTEINIEDVYISVQKSIDRW